MLHKIDIKRWLKDEKGNKLTKPIIKEDGEEVYKPVLQFVAIKRLDTGEWA